MPYYRRTETEEQEKLDKGWEYELDRQNQEKKVFENKIPSKEHNPQDENNCAPKALKILFLFFIVSSQLYRIIT